MAMTQVETVAGRLLASVHAVDLDLSVRTHGWARADIIEALAVAGGWQELEALYKVFQQRTDAKILKDQQDGVPYGRAFVRYVRFRVKPDATVCRCGNPGHHV